MVRILEVVMDILFECFEFEVLCFFFGWLVVVNYFVWNLIIIVLEYIGEVLEKLELRKDFFKLYFFDKDEDGY